MLLIDVPLSIRLQPIPEELKIKFSNFRISPAGWVLTAIQVCRCQP